MVNSIKLRNKGVLKLDIKEVIKIIKELMNYGYGEICIKIHKGKISLVEKTTKHQ